MEGNRNRVVVIRAIGDIDLQDKINMTLNLMKKDYGGKLDHIDYLQDNEHYTAIIHYLLPKDYLKRTIKSIKDLKKKATKLKEKGKKKIEKYKEKRANKSV